MIPSEIRDYETYIVAYSGGKDSTATLKLMLGTLPRSFWYPWHSIARHFKWSWWRRIWLRPAKLRVVFNPTGLADPPELQGYLRYIEGQLDVAIERAQAGDEPLPPKPDRKPRQPWQHATTLFEMIRLRGMWPGARYRYCNTYLKQWPMALYGQRLPKPILITGQRADESKARMGLPSFSEGGNKSIGRNALPIYRPILAWSECDVWAYLQANDILPNSVYNYQSRCGCWCCIMASDTDVLNFCYLHPDIAQKAADLEQEISHTWKDGQSIGNLLRQARAQMPLFEPQPRFEEAAA